MDGLILTTRPGAKKSQTFSEKSVDNRISIMYNIDTN